MAGKTQHIVAKTDWTKVTDECDVNRTAPSATTGEGFGSGGADSSGTNGHTPPNRRGMLPSDSQIYLLAAGQNGELVCRGSLDANSFQRNGLIDEYGHRDGDGDYSSGGPQRWDEFTEEGGDYYQDYESESDQSGGYVVTLPVNMPGQGSNETVERIFFIREPTQETARQDERSEDGSHDLRDDETGGESLKDRSTLSKAPEVYHPSGPNIGHLSVHVDTGDESDEELEDDNISRIEAEIRGRLLGRANFRKLQDARRSSAPSTMMSESDCAPAERSIARITIKNANKSTNGVEENDNAGSEAGSPRALGEKDIRIHGPSASDPRIVTLAFQQAMLAHAQQNMNDASSEPNHGKEKPLGTSDKSVPEINIIPAENLDDMDDVQPMFATWTRSHDHRFLAPIAEEVGTGSDWVSPRAGKPRTKLTTTHEKVHRIPKTILQIMSNRKLHMEVQQCVTVPSGPDAELHEKQDEAAGDALACHHAPETSGLAISGEKLGEGDESSDPGETNQNVSPRTLEKIGSIIESTIDGRERAADPLLETPAWTLVENAMQGKVNQGFDGEGDVEKSKTDALTSRDVAEREGIPNTSLKQNESQNESGGSDASLNVSEGSTLEVTNPHQAVERLSDQMNIPHNQRFTHEQDNESTNDTSKRDVASCNDENEDKIPHSHLMRQPKLEDDFPVGNQITTLSTTRTPPLQRYSNIKDSLEVGDQDPILINSALKSSSNNLPMGKTSSEATTQSQQGVSRTMSSVNKSNYTNDTSTSKTYTNDALLKETEINKSPDIADKKNDREDIDVTAIKEGKRRSSKASLTGVKSFPITRMRAFSIDGSLYVICPNNLSAGKTGDLMLAGSALGVGGRLSKRLSLGGEGSVPRNRFYDGRRVSLPVQQTHVVPIKNNTDFLDTDRKRELRANAKVDLV